MSDRCEPPEELRGVDGWHWLVWEPAGENGPPYDPVTIWWDKEAQGWCPDIAEDNRTRKLAEYRYLAPVTPPATVAALVEALEAADEFIRNGIEFGYIRMPHPATPDPAHKTPGKIAAALSLYRGETT